MAMVSSTLIIPLFPYVVVTIITTLSSQLATSQPNFLYHSCVNSKGNYTTNSTYHKNLISLFSDIISSDDDDTHYHYGFFNSSYGQSYLDRVNAIAMCRGDVGPRACRACLEDSTRLLTRLCPNRKEAIGWYDRCMLRYSYRSIFQHKETGPGFYSSWGQKSNYNNNNGSRELLESLRSEAASGDWRRKFGVGKAEIVIRVNYSRRNERVYGHVQCTPDLTEESCSDCLSLVIGSDIPRCCEGSLRVRVGRPSCNVGLDTFAYYDLTYVPLSSLPVLLPPPSPPPPPSSTTDVVPVEGNSNLFRTLVIAIIMPIVAFLVLLILVSIYSRLKKLYIKSQTDEADDDENKDSEKFLFDFETIKVATDDFSNANKLGQGGFGLVYKGRLPNGQEIAIKRLSQNSGQGDMEFKNEVLFLTKLQHRNLVRLLGFCLEGGERLLVYEFLPNKSLDYFIFDPIKRVHLGWQRRYEIIKGIARGLLYLHVDSQFRIIHRDLKASNILLDEEMNPKISDFGMTRLFNMDQTHGQTNKIAGTYGYMAPEYAVHGQFSMKSDIFSFGVLVLEIISGQKNNDICHGEYPEHLISFAWKNWREGTLSKIVDPTLDYGNSSRNEIMKCIQIGLLCVQKNVGYRPNMGCVAQMLDGYSQLLPIPKKPAYYVDSSSRLLENESDQEDHIKSVNIEASITELFPR